MLHTLPRHDQNATPCLRDNSFAFFLKFAANVTEYIGCRDVVCRTFALRISVESITFYFLKEKTPRRALKDGQPSSFVSSPA